jgi:hypothetical protein
MAIRFGDSAEIPGVEIILPGNPQQSEVGIASGHRHRIGAEEKALFTGA